MTQKTIAEKFQKLSEIDHVLLRPGRYVGSIAPHTDETWLYDPTTKRMVRKPATWCPALLKVFDEIISNSVDFSKTKDGSHLTTIKVTFDQTDGSIVVFDDGGIVVAKHPEHDQWVPELIYELRAGSNFNDEEEGADNEFGTGQNGEGAALTSIFATSFHVHTCDGTNQFDQTHLENSKKKTNPKVRPGARRGTTITWTPDYEKFGLTGLDDDNLAILVKRVVDVAGTNPKLKVVLNGEHIKIKDFQDYVELYTGEYAFEGNEHWKVAVAHSDNGFQHTSFVNGTLTRIGGPHVDYIRHQICNKLREYFNKKHKVDLKPSELSNHFQLFIDAQIIRPRYDSQTKDNLITEAKAFGTSIELSDKLIKKLINSEIIASVLDWVKAKEQADINAQLRKLARDNNKANPNAVEKFSDAVEKRERIKCELYLSEGDSARSSIQNARGKNPYIGSFALKGKPLNVMDADVKDIIANTEIKNILTITGLELGKPVERLEDIRFGKIIAMSDQDLDGFHISALLFNLFARFWPELFEMGAIYRLNTPLYIVTTSNKETLEFFTEEAYRDWSTKGIKHKADYFKGLGTFESEEFENILNNREKYLVKISLLEAKDTEALELAFSGQRADDRKDWLNDTSYFRNYD